MGTLIPMESKLHLSKNREMSIAFYYKMWYNYFKYKINWRNNNGGISPDVFF